MTQHKLTYAQYPESGKVIWAQTPAEFRHLSNTSKKLSELLLTMTGRFCFKHIFTTGERIAMPRLAPSRRYAPRLFSNIPAALLAVLLLFPCAAKANLLEPEPQVIINNDVQLPAGFSSASLRSIFFGRMQTWPDGTPITVFVLPESHPLHRRFCTCLLYTSDAADE